MEARKEEAIAAIKELESRCVVLSAQIEEKEKEFWDEGGELSRNLEEIKDRRQKYQDSVTQLQEEVLKVVSDAGTPLMLCRRLVMESYNAAQSAQEANIQQTVLDSKREAYRKIVERLDELSTKIEKKSADIVKQILYDELIHRELGEDGLERSEMTATTMMLFNRLISDTFQTLGASVASLLSGLEAQETELTNLDAHISAVSRKSKAEELYGELRMLQRTYDREKSDWDRQKEYVSDVEKQSKNIQFRRNQIIKSIAEKENERDDSARIVQYAAMSVEVLSEFKIRLQREKLSRLSAAATVCFKELVEKGSLVSEIMIDPETLNVTILDTEGRILQKNQLSAGEQQMFAISIVWALAITSGYRAPVIIDTPMARLDSANRTNFVKKYLPSASAQVIVLSTDEEIYGQYYSMIEDNISKTYLLQYSESEQCTSIVSGYFQRK